MDKERNQANWNLFMTFAELFKYPEEKLYDELISGEIDNEIKNYGLAAGQPLITNFKENTGMYDELVQSFNECFLGIKKPFAPPVESVYKVWTTDDSYQVPFKNQKGHLLGDSALHVQHIIDALGLEIPPEYKMTPDHLTILLELYAYFHGQGLLEEARQFKQDHLDWLPDLYDSLSKVNENQPYKDIVLSLIEILNNS